MKNLMVFLSIIGSQLLYGQQGTQNYYYHYKDSVINLTLYSKGIYVKFTHYSTYTEREEVVSSVFNLTQSSIQDIINSSFDYFILNLTDSLDGSALENKLAELKNDYPIVIAANPVFSNDGHVEGIADRFLVKISDNSSIPLLDNMLNANGDSVYCREFWDTSIFVIACTKNSSLNSLQQANLFYQSGLFSFCEPDFLLVQGPSSTPNDTYYSSQWALNNTGQSLGGGTAGADIKIENAWQITTGDPNIIIADLDLGVDLTHPDLQANLLTGYDATWIGNGGSQSSVNTFGGPVGTDYHGTGTAGIVAAVGNNSMGIAGVAYGCKILPVRIGTSSSILNSDAANAVAWAASPTGGHADVLTNSWGGMSQNSTMDDAIWYAVTQGRNGLGCVVVFASGNGDPAGFAYNYVAYPASNNNTLSVGASDEFGGLAGAYTTNSKYRAYSNYNTGLDVVAPGGSVNLHDPIGDTYEGNIYTTVTPGCALDNGGGYTTYFNGTSAACPNAAGVAALILSVNKCLSYQSVINIIEFTATKWSYSAEPLDYDNGEPHDYCYSSAYPHGTWNEYLGYGCVNAGEAVSVAYSSEPFVVNYSTEQNYTEGSLSSIYYSNLAGIADCQSNGLANGAYYVYPYLVTTNINFPYTLNPILAPSSVGSTNGWSPYSPNDGQAWCGIYNVTNTSATLYSYVYDFYDLSLNEIGWYPCRPTQVAWYWCIVSAIPSSDWYFQNQNVNFTDNYSAINNIYAGYDVYPPSTLGNYTIQNGADIGFHAGNAIYLENGFKALSGSNFVAAIGPAFYPCSEYPDPKRPVRPDTNQNNQYYPTTKSPNDTVIENAVNYPNPFSDYTTFQINLPKDEEHVFIRITDVLGREVYASTKSFNRGVNSLIINGLSWSSGCYFYEIITSHKKLCGKIVKIE